MTKSKKVKNEFIIMCPPLCDYPEAPDDQPECTLIKCPMCDKKMWISKKKRILKKSVKKPYLTCYKCLMKIIDDGLFQGSIINRIDI